MPESRTQCVISFCNASFAAYLSIGSIRQRCWKGRFISMKNACICRRFSLNTLSLHQSIVCAGAKIALVGDVINQPCTFQIPYCVDPVRRRTILDIIYDQRLASIVCAESNSGKTDAAKQYPWVRVTLPVMESVHSG